MSDSVRERPRIAIVSPGLGNANNGNAQTAARWSRFLAPIADVTTASAWDGDAADALIALHAIKSAPSIAAFRAAAPHRPIVLVLTGTDLYGDLRGETARHSLQCASAVVVLQSEGLTRLTAMQRKKALVIEQSANALPARRRALPSSPADAPAPETISFVAVGHLRSEKDPLTLLRAAALLGGAFEIVHIGAALEPELARAASAAMRDIPGYRWLGGLGHAETRRRIAGASALVHPSRLEGGANVVIEAVRARVPVLASRIDGNIGLLGADYEGTFAVGDAAALAALLRRFAAEPTFAARLRAQCALRAPLFAPARERAAVRRLLTRCLEAAPPAG